MASCFSGRGSLLVAPAASGGFFILSGESEVKVDLQEDNESVLDARNGVNERVDWYVRNRRMTVTAECARIEQATLELLLKSYYATIAPATIAVPLPNPVVVGTIYPVQPALTPGSVSVHDAAMTPIGGANWTVDNDYGSIVFSNVTGFVQPFTVDADRAQYSSYALHDKLQTLVRARVHGINKVTGRKVLVEFYRLAIDIAEELALIQKGFTKMSVKFQALPDVSQPLNQTLGQYGRIILL